MSIQSEITRIQGNVSDALDAIYAKGVTIPSGANSDDLANLIGQIQSGTGSAITITDTPDAHGGIIREITAVSLAGDTVRSDVLLSGYTAHNALGEPIVGTASGGGSPNLQSKTNIDPTESSQTITADTGYDGLSSVQINAVDSDYVGSGVARKSSSDLTATGATVTVPAGYYSSSASKAVASGSTTAPASISGTAATVSTGTNTLTLTKSVSVTPSVTAGYVSSGTAGNSSVSLTANVTTKAAATITPGTSNQTIASGTYLTGAQTISGDANLVAGNIKSGTSIFGVLGTYAGGGGGIGTLLTTYAVGSVSTSSTSAGDTGKSISVSSISAYDLLLVETSVDTVTNNRHTCTVGLILLTASSDVGTKDGATVMSNKLNMKISSAGATSTRQNTTAYGIYPNSCTLSNGNATIPLYRRYNSTYTGTINGTYTARVYGIKLYDLIGG